MGTAVFEDHSSQRDARVRVAIKSKVPDRPGVDAALVFFNFTEHLHRSDFWRARYGACRKRGTHHIEGAFPLPECACDMRYDVHDMAVALNGHEVGDLHRAKFCDATDIVPG